MRADLLPLLACPGCRGALRLFASTEEGPHVLTGHLECLSCRSVWPIVRGVPRLIVGVETRDVEDTGHAFAFSWKTFSHVAPYHREQFLAWIAPLQPGDLAGQVVLDAGCGKGRHTLAAHGFGAQAVVGVDLSDAVEVAFQATRDLPHAHIVQANIYHLPFRPQTFDVAWSVGVLHHLPDPAGGFARVFDQVKAGGRIAVWVYGRENNEWIVRWVNPLRQHLFTVMPRSWLLLLSALLSVPLYVGLKAVYRPLNRLHPALAERWLPYNAYCASIAAFPWREVHNIVFDQMVAPTAFYLPRSEVERWLARDDAQDVSIGWHNRNSWRGFAVRGGA